MTEDTAQVNLNTGPIIARADRRYRLKWVVMGVVLLAGSGWFLYDGYVGYQRENAAAIRAATDQGKPPPDKLPHSNTDIGLQKVIAWALQPIAILTLVRTFYSSRGVYQLADGVLRTPGHPEVPLTSIRAIDKSKWDRKGIAYLDYEVPGSTQTGRLKLDDYVYERGPTDRILEEIERAVVPPEPVTT